ncbi:MAG TPA: hypothetical protein VFT50_16235 [Baekduia sp.]|nr:hypothetical protein [Baekduia sp.]
MLIVLGCAMAVAAAGCGGRAPAGSSPSGPAVHASPATPPGLEAQMRALLRHASSRPAVPVAGLRARCFREGAGRCIPVCQRLLAAAAHVDCATPRNPRGRRLPIGRHRQKRN